MKTLLLTTAVLASMSGAALAQNATDGMFRPAPAGIDLRASNFIGMRVYLSEASIDATEYNGTQAEWDDIGEINDVVLTRDGKIDAVLVDIGGFLGLGERQVAVGMEAIKFVSDSATADNADDFFLVMSAARADLEAAPDYMVRDAAPMAASETTAADPAATTARTPIARDGYVAAEAEFLTSEKLMNAKVYDSADTLIGNVGDLVLSDAGQVTQAVVDVGGFLGMGEKPVALAIADVDILRTDGGDEVRVYLSKTKAELEAMPTFGG